MKCTRVISVGSAMLLGLSVARAVDVDPAGRAAAKRVAVGTCEPCHGRQGHSINPEFPVLAGQHASYLVAQLQAFKAQTRGDAGAIGYMWGMAAQLDDTMIAGLADYYSRQSPRAGPRGDPNLIARGKQIYQNGDSARGVPACAACHEPNAAGTDALPLLAGQHADYLIKELRSFQNNMRDVAVMHGVAQGLPLEEMQAVATYLQSLGPQ